MQKVKRSEGARVAKGQRCQGCQVIKVTSNKGAKVKRSSKGQGVLKNSLRSSLTPEEGPSCMRIEILLTKDYRFMSPWLLFRKFIFPSVKLDS